VNIADLWQNVARAMFFGFIVGIVMTIVFMLSSYSIVDTNLRAAAFEQRVMNYAQQHPKDSLLSLTKQQFESILTTYPDSSLTPDKLGLRIIVLDPLTKKIAVPVDDAQYKLIYDPDQLIINWFPATTTDTSTLKINYVSSVTYRLYTDPTTKKTYLLEFQFISA